MQSEFKIVTTNRINDGNGMSVLMSTEIQSHSKNLQAVNYERFVI